MRILILFLLLSSSFAQEDVTSEPLKDGVDESLSKYNGEWAVEESQTSALENDYSLVLKSDGKHHAISYQLKNPVKFDADEFVFQYEVKFENDVECAGAYAKLLSVSNEPLVEIPDPNDTKPDDWDERKKIPDPLASKPDDWNENEPEYIPNQNAVMPDNWREDLPVTIPDPKAQRPADYDDELDGEWSAPNIPNPECEGLSGCGPWARPLERNPAYQGKWKPDLIDNANYKGPWKPRNIPNPDYFEDKQPFRSLTHIGALGLELWSMSKNIVFDNFLIVNSKAEADRFAEQTWSIKRDAEKRGDPSSKSVVDAFMEAVREKPWMVFLVGVLCALPVLLCCFYMCRSPTTRSSAHHKKTDAVTPDEEVVDELIDEKSDDTCEVINPNEEVDEETPVNGVGDSGPPSSGHRSRSPSDAESVGSSGSQDNEPSSPATRLRSRKY